MALPIALRCVLLIPLAAASCERRPTSHPNLVLITVDALRADHVGSYGYRLPTSPTMDRLAATGVRFTDVTVQWPKTWPSVASLLTGTYPATNGIRFSPRRPLPRENVTLAETLRASGYRTGAVVSNVNLGRAFGFDQGFERFVESWTDEVLRQTGKTTFRNAPGLVKHFTNARIVTDQAIQLLDGLGGADQPFFLWLHYIDPHGPYVPPAQYAGLFADAHPVSLVSLEKLPSYQLQQQPGTDMISNDLGFYAAQYDREIRHFDDQLSRLLGELDARGLRNDTLLVLTADHGESLTEHGYYLEHGAAPYQPTAAVPLIAVWPGRIRPGGVVDSPVGLIDVFPTLIDLLGMDRAAGLQGVSLEPLIDAQSESGGPPFVFMESGARAKTQLVVRRGRWKLVQLRAKEDRDWLAREEVELYDLGTDPAEARDVASQHPEVVAELREAIVRWQATTPPYAGQQRSTDLGTLDARTQQMLRGLGYVD